jgi:hypothetical protein
VFVFAFALSLAFILLLVTFRSIVVPVGQRGSRPRGGSLAP